MCLLECDSEALSVDEAVGVVAAIEAPWTRLVTADCAARIGAIVARDTETPVRIVFDERL